MDLEYAKLKCAILRKRILDISVKVSAIHIGGSFSSVELMQVVFYNFLLKKNKFKNFIFSKGHASILHYVILEDLGILKKKDIDGYCKKNGKLGVHPNIKTKGINVATGSLGHGLGIACGMAYACPDDIFFVLMSDGELQEGSVWEAIISVTSLKVKNVIVIIDNNDFQSSERMSLTHPNLYPIDKKFTTFGWQAINVNGHNSKEIYSSIKKKNKKKPLVIIAKTVKGYPVSYMKNNPIWHYRSPNQKELQIALKEINNEK